MQMFVFGTKALEKFIDRLNEWPQYCQHILQISHLRGAHPELVTFIERSVIRTSSGHPESDAAYNPAGDQHQSAIPQANVEVHLSYGLGCDLLLVHTNHIRQRSDL